MISKQAPKQNDITSIAVYVQRKHRTEHRMCDLAYKLLTRKSRTLLNLHVTETTHKNNNKKTHPDDLTHLTLNQPDPTRSGIINTFHTQTIFRTPSTNSTNQNAHAQTYLCRRCRTIHDEFPDTLKETATYCEYIYSVKS